MSEGEAEATVETIRQSEDRSLSSYPERSGRWKVSDEIQSTAVALQSIRGHDQTAPTFHSW